MWDPYAQFETAVLPNGLKVHCAHWPDRPWVQCGFVVRAGANEDPIGKEGLAHFVEHLVFQNAPMQRSEVQGLVEGFGGYADFGGTTFTETQYRFSLLYEHTRFADMLNIFGHALLTSTLQQCVESERKIILAEYRMHHTDESFYKIDLRTKKILLPGSRRARSLSALGSVKSIKEICAEDVQSFYDTHYIPPKMEIVCVGALSLSELLGYLNESPFSLTTRREPVFTVLPEINLSSLKVVRVKTVLQLAGEDADAEKTRVRFCTFARFPFSIPDAAFGLFSAMIHRLLMERIREKDQMVYRIGLRREHVEVCRLFAVFVSELTPDSLQKFEAAFEQVVSELPSQRLLFERLREQRILQKSFVDETGQSVLDNVIMDLDFHRRIIPLAEQCEELRRVTFEDVLQLLPFFQKKKRLTQLVYL